MCGFTSRERPIKIRITKRGLLPLRRRRRFVAAESCSRVVRFPFGSHDEDDYYTTPPGAGIYGLGDLAEDVLSHQETEEATNNADLWNGTRLVVGPFAKDRGN